MTAARPCLHLQAQAQKDGQVACLGGCGRVFVSDQAWCQAQDQAEALAGRLARQEALAASWQETNG
jgi:hypothetical protein